MLKKEFTREVMLDSLEHDYHSLMNLGDIYGARGVDTALNTLSLYERALTLACEEIQKSRAKKFTDTKTVPEIIKEYLGFAKAAAELEEFPEVS